jgi:hypothetical protein
VQKKSYKILDAILASGKEATIARGSFSNECVRSFVVGKFESIANTFVRSLSECNVAAKVPRLKCLIELMDYVSANEQKSFLRQILPEIMLCVKEVNHKSRETAFLLLSRMLKLWQKLGASLPQPVNEIGIFNIFVG